MFTWGQIFPRSIALNGIYQNVQELLSGLFRFSVTVDSFNRKNQNDVLFHHKSKRRGELGWETAASCLPLLFSRWLWCVTLYFYVGTSAAQTCTLVGNGRARSQGFSYLLLQTYLPSQVTTWQPWRGALSPLHRDCPSLAQLHALHLWITIFFLKWSV